MNVVLIFQVGITLALGWLGMQLWDYSFLVLRIGTKLKSLDGHKVELILSLSE